MVVFHEKHCYHYHRHGCYIGPGFVLTEFNGRKEGGTPEEQEWAMVPGDVAHAVYCVATQGPNSDIKEISIQVLDRS